MQIANQYSYIFIAVFVVSLCILAAALWFPGTGGLLAILFSLSAFIAISSLTRYRDDDTSGIPPDALIGKGLPVLLAVYSNF